MTEREPDSQSGNQEANSNTFVAEFVSAGFQSLSMAGSFRKVHTASDLSNPLLSRTCSSSSGKSVIKHAISLPSFPSRRPDSTIPTHSRHESSSSLRRCYFWIQMGLLCCLAVMVGGAVLMLGTPHIPGTAKRSIQVVYTSEFSSNSEEGDFLGHAMIPFAKASSASPILDALTFRAPALYTVERQQGSPADLNSQLEQLPYRSQAITEQCPQSETVRVFVGIASRASVAGLPKRDTIRATWMQDITTVYADRVKAQFLLSQPAKDVETVAKDLEMEVERYGDLAIVPGVEDYFRLPEKTFSMLRYALSSACHYTHILKTDDDVYLRTGYLLDVIDRGLFDATLRIQAESIVDYWMFKRPHREGPGNQVPWMEKMFIGKVDRNVTGTYPGFVPVRDPKNKWYLSEEAYPDTLGPHRIRWISGWGYLMSRDVVERAVQNVMDPGPKPAWFGRLPWEDVAMAAILKNYVRLSHIDSFKAAWDTCDNKTILKHLDNQVALIPGLREQELNGVWKVHEVPCSAGNYTEGNYEEWRRWRNKQSDSTVNGIM